MVLYNAVVHQTGHLPRVTSLQVCLIAEKYTYLTTSVYYRMIGRNNTWSGEDTLLTQSVGIDTFAEVFEEELWT